MALREIDLTWEATAIPDAAARFIAEADRRYDLFHESGGRRRFPRYVPSEPAQVFTALRRIAGSELLLGRVFCEWGSGFGVATGLAALLGFEAHGVEIEEPLTNQARALLADCGIDATIIQSSYIPEGYTNYSAWGGDQLIEDASSSYGAAERAFSPRYAGMDCDLDEIDLFFVYPWPPEQEMMLELFDRFAGDGALLLVYFGDNELCLYQRVPGSGEPSAEQDDED